MPPISTNESAKNNDFINTPTSCDGFQRKDDSSQLFQHLHNSGLLNRFLVSVNRPSIFLLKFSKNLLRRKRRSFPAITYFAGVATVDRAAIGNIAKPD